jgi:hypothetical protein
VAFGPQRALDSGASIPRRRISMAISSPGHTRTRASKVSPSITRSTSAESAADTAPGSCPTPSGSIIGRATGAAGAGLLRMAGRPRLRLRGRPKMPGPWSNCDADHRNIFWRAGSYSYTSGDPNPGQPQKRLHLRSRATMRRLSKIACNAFDFPIAVADRIRPVAAVQLPRLLPGFAIDFGAASLRFRKRPLGRGRAHLVFSNPQRQWNLCGHAPFKMRIVPGTSRRRTR